MTPGRAVTPGATTAARPPAPSPARVTDPVDLSDRSHDTTGGVVAGERAVPYHCPFCAEEDLRPHGTTRGAWHCRSCLRVFAVRFLGLERVAPVERGAPEVPGA